jgi:hypothetical protein
LKNQRRDGRDAAKDEAAYGFFMELSVDNRIFLKEKRLWLGRATFVLCFSAAILDTCKTHVSVISITDKKS